MVLELKQEELNKLDDLLSNEWRGTRPYLARPDKVKITAKQVKMAKSLLKTGVPMVTIQNLTKLSEYHVRGVRRQV